jgi:hypothetical protein
MTAPVFLVHVCQTIRVGHVIVTTGSSKSRGLVRPALGGVIANRQELPTVWRSASALRTATVFELLERHLASHADARDEVEPVSAGLQINGHHSAL